MLRQAGPLNARLTVIVVFDCLPVNFFFFANYDHKDLVDSYNANHPDRGPHA